MKQLVFLTFCYTTAGIGNRKVGSNELMEGQTDVKTEIVVKINGCYYRLIT